MVAVLDNALTVMLLSLHSAAPNVTSFSHESMA
jgi:hypothetical protein